MTAIAGAVSMALSSCIHDVPGPPPITDPNSVTFVVSTPTASATESGVTRAAVSTPETDTRGGNGHFPDGVPADYRNYRQGADIATYGTVFGGYPDAGAEARAFEEAVAAMAANWENSPAAKSGVVPAAPGTSASPATRQITDGSDAENDIEELIVVLFDGTGKYIERYLVVGSDLDRIPGDETRRRFTIQNLRSGTYKALVLANCSTEITAHINGRTEEQLKAQETITTFRDNIEVGHILSATNPWNSTPGSAGYRRFPMSSLEETFTVPVTRDFETDPVKLLRSLVRVSVTLDPSMPNYEGLRIGQIVVRNFNSRGRLIPSAAWGTTLQGSNEVDMFHAPSLNDVATSHNITDRLVYDYPAGKTPAKGDIFVWEQVADNSSPTWLDWNRDNFCLLVRFDKFAVDGPNGGTFENNDGVWFRIDLLKDNGGDNPDRVNLLRNFSYDVTITDITTRGYSSEQDAFDNAPAGLTFAIDAQDEEDGDTGITETTWNGRYQLATDRTVVVIGPDVDDTATVMAYTDYLHGLTTPVSPAFGPSDVITATEGTSSPNGPKAIPITLKVGAAYMGTTVRKINFTIEAGELFKDMVLIQLPHPDRVAAGSPVLSDYVGAFWRADQRGERLIGLKSDKKWSAFVIDGAPGDPADWVVLDSKPSTDPNVHSSSSTPSLGNEAGFEKGHAVTSTVGWATGNGSESYFRVGLRTTHASTPAAPARYARVLLVEGSVTERGGFANPQILYLRQGHEADYLFPKSERDTDANMRFSPYNLTVPEAKRTGVFETDGMVPLDPQGGVFTDYPTQAGAMFRGVTLSLSAIHPLKDIDPAIWGDFNMTIPFNSSTMESCPPGYRRPTGGAMTDELPQSLWYNRSTTIAAGDTSNSVFGYYADGYFDRKSIGTPVVPSGSSEPNSAVDVDGTGVAYRGNLYFNPSSGASLFMPAAGYKNNAGLAYGIGYDGIYWTSSMTKYDIYSRDDVGAQLHFKYLGNAIFDNWQRGDATVIRCVKNLDYEPFPELVQAPPGVIGIKHSDLVAMRNGTKRVLLSQNIWSQWLQQHQESAFPLDYSLTIRGSSTYKGTWVERIATGDPNIGALEEEPVYMVYFKWGSITAILGSDGTLPNGRVQLVWTIPGRTGDGWQWDDNGVTDYYFTGGVIDSPNNHYWPSPAKPATGAVPGAGGYDIPKWEPEPGPGMSGIWGQSEFMMWGDPCEFVNGATPDRRSGWRTPLGNPWTYVNAAENISVPFGVATQPLVGSNARWIDASESVPAGVATNDGSIFLPAAGAYDNYGDFILQGLGGAYWTASSSTFTSTGSNVSNSGFWNAYALQFASSQSQPASISDSRYAMPVRCINCDPVEGISISGMVDTTPITGVPELVIGNQPQMVTLTASDPTPAGATQPVSWHWEYSIGDETSWIKIPGSDGKTTIITSTHDDEPGMNFAMVGGTNQFRVVVSNPCSRVYSNPIKVRLTLPKLTYAIIGSSEWSWNQHRKVALHYATHNDNGVLNVQNDNAVIKTEGLTQLWTTNSNNIASNNLNNGFSGTVDGTVYTNEQPDIVLYYSFGLPPTSDIIAALTNYMNNKGTILFGAAADNPTYTTQLSNFINAIFPGTECVQQTPDTLYDSAYRIFNEIGPDPLTNDPIVNGPFGNLSGGNCYIGEDNIGTFIVKNLPPGAVQIASMWHPRTIATGNYPDPSQHRREWSFCWYHEGKNFFCINDCTSARPSALTYDYPAVYDVDTYSIPQNPTAAQRARTGAPGSKMYGVYEGNFTSASQGGNVMTYNAVLEMNALAWCMTRAARNGINEH